MTSNNSKRVYGGIDTTEFTDTQLSSANSDEKADKKIDSLHTAVQEFVSHEQAVVFGLHSLDQ